MCPTERLSTPPAIVVAGDDAGLSPGPAARKQRSMLSRRPAHRRRDRRRHARHRQQCGRRTPARADRRAVASRVADQRSARARRDRPRPFPRGRPGPRRKRGKASRGGHGHLGVGSLTSYLEFARPLPVGALFCVIHGPTAGRHWEPSLRVSAGSNGGSSRRPSALRATSVRHAHAVELAHEGVPLIIIQRQLGHATRGSPHLPPGNRQLRDHRDAPFTARTGDLSDFRPAPRSVGTGC